MRRERGAALLLALFVVVTGALVALGVLGAASAAYKRAIQDTNRQRMRNIAESGIDRLRYLMVTNKSLSVSDSATVDSGTYSASTAIVDATTGVVDVTSTATLNGQTLAITRRIGCYYHIDRPFDYALAKSSTDQDGNTFVTGSGGALGDVRVNGDLHWGPTVSTVNGNVIVSGTIVGMMPLWSGTVTFGAPLLNFAAPNYATLSTAADRSLLIGVSLLGMSFLKANELVYCGGDMTITAGTVSGTGTLVVNGKLTISGSLTYANASCKLVVIAQNIQVTPLIGNPTLNGYFYCPSGDFKCTKITTVVGCIACQTLSNTKDMNITLDPALRDDPDLGYNMHLPGY